MPPRLPQPSIGLTRIARRVTASRECAKCLFCTYSTPLLRKESRQSLRKLNSPTATSTTQRGQRPYSSTSPPSNDARIELQIALQDLQKHASRFVNLSRLQLALNGLQHQPGDEPIRIAILGLTDDGKSYETAKELLRLLLADPLKGEEEWETILLQATQTGKSLLLRIGHDGAETNSSGNWLIQELKVSSPALNGHKVEFLILSLDPATDLLPEQFTESLLVPALEIPTSSTGRHTNVTTPVHKCIVVGDGLRGVASIATFPTVDGDVIHPAIDIQLANDEIDAPFQVVNVARGSAALKSFRESIENAMEYEHKWFGSGLPELLDWIKLDTAQVSGSLKAPVKKLIESLLSSISNAVEAEAATRLANILSQKVSQDDLTSLKRELSVWAEQAHTELRDQLDIAFDGRRWRKLSWWKLFWRVDDVSMISSDILNRSFLTEADKNIIYLAGQIAQAKDVERSAYNDPNWAYTPVVSTEAAPRLGDEPKPLTLQNLPEPRHRIIKYQNPEWPVHIPLAREHLALKTVPALQALAQKLVLQTFTTSSFASIAAGLMYISTMSTGLYEAGAVAALGLVWSMRRMQTKWETARKYWEGEVREEGRKAVRGVEGVVTEVLSPKDQPIVVDEELEKARALVSRAEDALSRTK